MKVRRWSDVKKIAELKADRRALLRTIEVVAQEHEATLNNLTATQQRCTELLEENRVLKAKLKLEMQ